MRPSEFNPSLPGVELDEDGTPPDWLLDVVDLKYLERRLRELRRKVRDGLAEDERAEWEWLELLNNHRQSRRRAVIEHERGEAWLRRWGPVWWIGGPAVLLLILSLLTR